MGLKESGLRGSIRNVSTGIGAAITIDTLEAENIEADSATIRGEITELTNFGEDAEVFFEWGETTEGLPNTTDIQLQDTVGVFTEDLTNLSEDTTHEFQAFGSVRDVSDDGVVLTFETAPPAIPDSGVARWPCNDDDTQNTLEDDWDNELDGTISGASYDTSEFEIGSASLNFDSSTDEVSIGWPSELQFVDGDSFSFTVWVYRDNNLFDSRGTPITIGHQNDDRVVIFDNDDNQEMFFRVGGEQIGAIDYNRNEWTHWAGTFADENGELTFYKDGSEVGNETGGGLPDTADNYGTKEVQIGNDPSAGNYAYPGNIDDIRVYDKELTQEEVENIMNGELI